MIDTKLKYRSFVGQKHADIAYKLIDSDIENFAIKFINHLLAENEITFTNNKVIVKPTSIYTIDDIVSKDYIYDYRYNIKATGFWLLKDNENMDDKSPTYAIIHRETYFTIEGNRSVYKTFDEAYKEIIKKFKRNKWVW